MHDRVSYIVGFAAVVCVICALMVSSAAVLLKSRQLENRLLDKQKNVLFAAGLASPTEPISREEIQRLFEKVKPVVVDLETGEPVSDPPFDVATYDPERAAEDPAMSDPAPENPSRIQRLPKYTVVYQVLGDSGQPTMVVIPIKGYGLWSTLYGFLALASDTTTVRGITYYQHGETPGLGGEVDNNRWKSLWPGRKAYNENWEPALKVIKGQAGPPSSDPYEVDGLSGASITSRGVSNMLQFWLGKNGFGPYLEHFRENQKS